MPGRRKTVEQRLRKDLGLGIAAWFAVSSCASAAIAQTAPLIPPPQDLLPPTNPNLLPSPTLPTVPPAPAKLTPPTAKPLPQIPNTIPGAIVVKRFVILGSTIFSQEELLAELKKNKLLDRPLSFAELLQAQVVVTEYFTSRGYKTSGAVIPPQTVEEEGVVKIQVVEGSLEAINVTGTRRLKPNYVRSRLAVAATKPLNERRLLEALKLLQLDPLIQNISAELSAGARPGTNRLDVKVTEARSFKAQLGLNNGRSPAVGSFRRQLDVSEANLLGIGDGLSISYANTDGSNLGDLTYTLPINPYNGTVSVRISQGGNLITEKPFDQIDIRATSRSFDLSLRQPFFRTSAQEFAAGISLSQQSSRTSVLGVPLAISPGADNQGETRVAALRFFQEWTDRRAQSVFAVRSQFSVGLNVFNATINKTAPDGRFFAWRGQMQWLRLLAPDTLLLLRSDLQLADRSLLPLEQLSLGGADSVRGYRQDLLLTDNGWLGSAEVRLPLLRAPESQGLLQAISFIDLGKGWNASGTNPDPSTLAAVGLGLRWQQGDRLTARLDWGIPLVSVTAEKRTWQENGVYFSIVYNLF